MMGIATGLLKIVSSIKTPKKKVIAEGIYGGDWLESHICAIRIQVPEGIKRIESGYSFDLYRPIDGSFQRPVSQEEILELRRLAPFSVRTVLVEDGRIYHRPELRNGSNNWVLDNILAHVTEQGGFDKVYDAIQQSRR